MQRISALQPSGDVMVLEVTPEMTGKELKQQIKERKPWDELTRRTTGVEVILGDSHLLASDATVLEAGIAEDTVVSVVFKPNKVICSNKDAIASLGGIVDSELLLVVEIPDDDTQIHDKSFEGCRTLAKVTIPDTVTHIGNSAFAWCGSLVDLTISDSVTHIGDGAFRDCSSLASLIIPDSVTHIGAGAFFGCSSLVNLTIPNSLTDIGDYAFADCSSLASLTIPNSVTHIGNDAFLGCSSLVLRVSVSGSRVEMYRLEGCQRIVATECHCDQCQYTWFLKGWVCPKQWCHRHDQSSKQDRQG